MPVGVGRGVCRHDSSRGNENGSIQDCSRGGRRRTCADGKPLGRALWEAGLHEGGGSVEYPHINPVSHRPEPKVSFVEKLGDDVCGVGAYKG